MATDRFTDSHTTDLGSDAGFQRGSGSHHGRPATLLRRGLAVTFGLVLAASAMLGTTQPPANAAVVPGVAEQCNGIQNEGGQAVECDVTITNYLDVATGRSTSIIEARSCIGAANTELLCTVLPVTYTTATTVVDQCNASGQGGGATVTCRVEVENNIIGDTTLTPATVNQCIGSGGGGGTEPTLNCNPVESTTNATITQCNGAANGGGGTRRVTCDVQPSTKSTALPVTIEQCNNDGVTAPGSYVTCTASLTHRLLPAGTVIPTPTNTATPVPTATPTQTASPIAPVTPTSTPTPAPTSKASPLLPAASSAQGTALAETGVDVQPVVMMASGALLLGGILLAVVLIRRRTAATAG